MFPAAFLTQTGEREQKTVADEPRHDEPLAAARTRRRLVDRLSSTSITLGLLMAASMVRRFCSSMCALPKWRGATASPGAALQVGVACSGDACVALGTIGQHCFQRNRSALCVRSVDPHACTPRARARAPRGGRARARVRQRVCARARRCSTARSAPRSRPRAPRSRGCPPQSIASVSLSSSLSFSKTTGHTRVRQPHHDAVPGLDGHRERPANTGWNDCANSTVEQRVAGPAPRGLCARPTPLEQTDSSTDCRSGSPSYARKHLGAKLPGSSSSHS